MSGNRCHKCLIPTLYSSPREVNKMPLLPYHWCGILWKWFKQELSWVLAAFDIPEGTYFTVDSESLMSPVAQKASLTVPLYATGSWLMHDWIIPSSFCALSMTENLVRLPLSA